MAQSSTLTIALAGNPNSGKTTAFNFYTGSRQHVANYPGITVERKECSLKAHNHNLRMIDLPGTYALTAYSEDELVARRGLTTEAPDCVINVLNAGALERNLYLAVQIMELGLPLVLAVNMYDEAEKQGVIINFQRLAELLGVPAIPTVARSGIGLDKVLGAAVQVALDTQASRRAQQQASCAVCSSAGNCATTQKNCSLAQEDCADSTKLPDSSAAAASNNIIDSDSVVSVSAIGQHINGQPLDISYGPDLDPVIADFTARIEAEPVLCSQYPPRWVAIKYLENDSEIRAQVLAINPELAARMDVGLESVTKHLKSTTGSYPEAIIADYRYGFISSLLRQGVITRQDDLRSRVAMSDRIDKVLTQRFFGPLILLGVLYAMYKITFGLGEIPMGWVEGLFGWLSAIVSAQMPDGLLKSLVVSGMLDGVGAVMGFVPLILIMFLLISVLEDSGYMARVAYMLDRILRAFGLHGYSVMPFIISGGIAGGCAVPGVLATRTLRSPREKLATILTLPFMTCGAKLPVFLLLVAAFFPGDETSVMLVISLSAWGMALLMAKLLRSTIIRGESTPFVMELPPYRLPTLFGVFIHTWERVWQYVKKAGTVILAISVIIWATMTFPVLPEELAAPYKTSIARLETSIANMIRVNAAANLADSERLPGDQADMMPADLRAHLRSSLQTELRAQRNALAAVALEHSFAGRMGKSMEFITAPAGFDWRVNIALLGGLGAKEVIVSALATSYSLGEAQHNETDSLQSRLRHNGKWNRASAAALMAFVLLYAPCFVTLIAIKQETGAWKWAAFSLIFNTLLAFAVAVVIYQVGSLIVT